MKSLMFFIILSTSLTGYAHLKIGQYTGLDEQGKECTITIKNVLFANQLKHPLNERVAVESSFMTGSMILVHLPVINSDNMTVRPNKNFLTGVMPIKTGAINLNLAMSHVPEMEGPSHIEYIKDNYKQSEYNEIRYCYGLKFKQ